MSCFVGFVQSYSCGRQHVGLLCNCCRTGLNAERKMWGGWAVTEGMLMCTCSYEKHRFQPCLALIAHSQESNTVNFSLTPLGASWLLNCPPSVARNHSQLVFLFPFFFQIRSRHACENSHMCEWISVSVIEMITSPRFVCIFQLRSRNASWTLKKKKKTKTVTPRGHTMLLQWPRAVHLPRSVWSLPFSWPVVCVWPTALCPCVLQRWKRTASVWKWRKPTSWIRCSSFTQHWRAERSNCGNSYATTTSIERCSRSFPVENC